MSITPQFKKGGKSEKPLYFLLDKPQMFFLSIFKIKNREYCLIVNKLRSQDREAEIRKEMKDANGGKKMRKERKKIDRKDKEKHQREFHRS